jgi:hypothetical protein
MSVLYVLLAIVVVLGLVAGQMLVLRRRGMECATASLQARAIRPRAFVRTLLAIFASCAFLVIAGYIMHLHTPSHWGFVVCLLLCVPAVIVFLFVPVPPAWLIATFGTGTARVIWSIFFGAAFTLIFFLFLEFYAGVVL